MTVPALFGYGGHTSFHRSSSVPPSASDRGDLWKLGGGSGGWHSHSTKGVSSAAMSALTLLVFLFFLNILQSCLQDMTYNQQPPPIVTVVSAPSSMREDGVTMMPMSVMVPMAMTTPPSKRSGRKKRGDPRELTLVRKQYVQLPHLSTHPNAPLKRLENPIAAAVITQRIQQHLPSHHVPAPPDPSTEHPHHHPLPEGPSLQYHAPTPPPESFYHHVPAPPETSAEHSHHHPLSQAPSLQYHAPTPPPESFYHHVTTPPGVIPSYHHIPTLGVLSQYPHHPLHQHVATPLPVATTTERRYIPVPLVAPGHNLENRVEEVTEGAEAEDYEDDPTPAPPAASPNIILVRPIVPIAASFRQLAWRAINAISRPLLPLLTLWRSGRGEDGASAEFCCSMLMCELERIRESGGTFRIRLAQILRGLTVWSCPTDSSLYHEDSDCKALITECVERTGRHTTFTTLASLLERYVP